MRDEPRTERAVVRLTGRSGWLLALLGAVLLLIVIPWSLQSSSLMSSVIITGILFIAVLGLDVLMGFGGQVSLGQAGFMAIGAYTASTLAVGYDVPPLLGTLAGLFLSLACAVVLALGTMRLRGLYLAIATLAFGLLVDSLTVGLDGLTGGPSGLVGIPSFSIAGYAFETPLQNYYLVASVIVVLLAALVGGMRSRFGARLARHPGRPACGGGARHPHPALQARGVLHQRRARIAVGQPVWLLLPLPGPGDGGHAGVVGRCWRCWSWAGRGRWSGRCSAP